MMKRDDRTSEDFGISESHSKIEKSYEASHKKSKKDRKHKRKHCSISIEGKSTEESPGVVQEKVEECTRGWKKKSKKDGDHKKKHGSISIEGKSPEEALVVAQENVDEISLVEDRTRGMKKGKLEHNGNCKGITLYQTFNEIASSMETKDAKLVSKIKTKKTKRGGKHKNKHCSINIKETNAEGTTGLVQEKVDEVSSVDEDCTRGMKKWLLQYKESRPGLQVLQQRIDEFITAHGQQQEEERKEREARVAEGGWTVVVHHKGRKKTTDAETGTTVGSVAPASVIGMLSQKKTKEIALDFYKFHKREAKRNEIMMLQSKFEQDKQRIQQLRATRKFRPY
ncbi:hypothetical protein HPP92_015315 [Vanilla planifolia]|uniref:Ribosomal RNA-processing protein 7 C-terminal domain-containing protein n=1 Tax=Vanilla planifolia TaxID=51239 RepID=A0A835QKY5_VANPL|nr:hypothetical protein HPP92_015315 [Vanilla planifolia]